MRVNVYVEYRLARIVLDNGAIKLTVDRLID